jgi:hypothetical protein
MMIHVRDVISPSARGHRSNPSIVFAALAVSHFIQSRTGLSIAKVVKKLRPLRNATIALNGAAQTFPPEISSSQRKILGDLGIAYYSKCPNSGVQRTAPVMTAAFPCN